MMGRVLLLSEGKIGMALFINGLDQPLLPQICDWHHEKLPSWLGLPHRDCSVIQGPGSVIFITKPFSFYRALRTEAVWRSPESEKTPGHGAGSRRRDLLLNWYKKGRER